MPLSGIYCLYFRLTSLNELNQREWREKRHFRLVLKRFSLYHRLTDNAESVLVL